eukprot:UN03489
MVNGVKDISPEIQTIKIYHTDSKVDFQIKFLDSFNLPANAETNLSFFKKMKLLGSISTSNFTLFDEHEKVQSFRDAIAILKKFYPIRLDFYDRRKKALVAYLKEELLRLSNQARFITMVVEKKLELRKPPKARNLRRALRIKI